MKNKYENHQTQEKCSLLAVDLKSLEIELICLPENHLTIAVTYFNIATTYTSLERSIEQLLKTLLVDHPEVAENRSYIETIKRKQMFKRLFDPNNTIDS